MTISVYSKTMKFNNICIFTTVKDCFSLVSAATNNQTTNKQTKNERKTMEFIAYVVIRV